MVRRVTAVAAANVAAIVMAMMLKTFIVLVLSGSVSVGNPASLDCDAKD